MHDLDGSGSSAEVVLVGAHKSIVLHCQDEVSREQEQVFITQLAPIVGNELQEQISAAHESQAVPGVHGAGVIVLESGVVASGVGVGSGVVVFGVVVSGVGVLSVVGSGVVEFDVAVSSVVVLLVVSGIVSGVGLVEFEAVLGGSVIDALVWLAEVGSAEGVLDAVLLLSHKSMSPHCQSNISSL